MAAKNIFGVQIFANFCYLHKTQIKKRIIPLQTQNLSYILKSIISCPILGVADGANVFHGSLA